MTMRLLVDAAHPEETRVVVIDGNRLEDFDYESSTKTQLRGNIYLAKVTRVEPSLQAAFVDYGGNRHGFLAFSEIHPDYYQIPVADREALLAAEAAHQRAEAETENFAVEDDAEAQDLEFAESDDVITDDDKSPNEGDDSESSASAQLTVEDESNGGNDTEVIGSDDDVETARRRRARLVRSYKIQEVIKRRQVLLVQVVKEERGNKGAALTTYLSLAGRYGVLMPNTARGGGISRKIGDSKDRRRLRQIVDDLEVPTGMGLIIRTAGANRNKSEIKRDYEFLLRSWDSVRDLTLKSTAPTMVYEEANLIKRTIRDLYSKDIEEVLVEGEEAYKAAKKFMRMLMPSHAKRVQPYRDPVPLFHRYQVEERFDTMHATEVRLKGGGYIVINPTEALVAVDVNSGKSTKERNIEETALRTNLEAAEELARHLRLRDLGGLIVIDFIDMNENRHNRAVERCIKEALQQDRARIQIGRISSFGLLEMSRQRMRPSLFEASSEPCSHCHGTGSVRSRESTALHVLRAIETEGIKKPGGDLTVSVAMPVAIYLLNQKRSTIAEIEKRHAMRVFIIGDETLVPPEIRIERTASTIEVVPERPVQIVEIDEDLDEISAIETNEETAPIDGEDDGQRGKRRRRGRRGGRRRSKRAPTDEALDGGVNENDQDSNQANAPTQEDQANPEVMGEAAVAQVEPPHATVDSVAAGDPDDTDIVVDHSQYEGTADSPDVADATASDAVLPAAEWHNPVPRDGSESLAVTDESSDSSEGASVMPISDADLAVVAEAIENDDQQPRKSRRGWWRRATE